MKLDPERKAILVTGASGFVGRYVLQELLKSQFQSYQVISCDRSGDGFQGIPHVSLDLTDFTAIEETVKQIKPVSVVHLAAIALPSAARDNSAMAWTLNFGATLALAQALVNYAPDARFVFASSSEVYGESFREKSAPIDEETPLKPRNVYAATKAAAELALLQLGYDGLDVVCFRSFNHCGKGQDPAYVVSSFASQLAEIRAGKKDKVIKVGNLEAARDFLDVRDVARAYTVAATRQSNDFSKADRVFNLSSGTPRKISNVLDRLIELFEVDVRIEQEVSRLRGNEVMSASGDPSRAKRTLGWVPEYSFDETLRTVVDDWGNRVSSND